MTWRQTRNTAIERGFHTIAKYKVMGTWIYVLWQGGQERYTTPTRISQHATIDEAKAAAEETPHPTKAGEP